MNTRSLRFQLVAWYAGLLTACFALIGAATYIVLQNNLVGALQQSLERRGRQVGQLLMEEVSWHGEARVGDEVEARYSPGRNDRFVRNPPVHGTRLERQRRVDCVEKPHNPPPVENWLCRCACPVRR